MTRRPARGLSLALLAALPALALSGLPARAEIVRSFEVELFLDPDGSYSVEEAIVYDFEGARRHGIYRKIPLDRGRGWLEELPLRLDVESVTDAAGRRRLSRVLGGSTQVEIRIGDPDRFVSGVQEYRIRYRVHRGLLFLEDHDELYWNATGNQWPVPIERAGVTVYLPPGLAAADVPVRCFTGPPGSTRQACRAEPRSQSLHFASTQRLGKGEGLTVALALPKGAIAEPGPLARLLEGLRALGGPWLLAPLAALAGMTGAWRRWGRDPLLRAAVPVRYEPPEGLSPAEVGTVLDESADLDDVTSTILDLAVRGHLRLEEVESQSFLFFSERDWRLVRLEADSRGLKRHEQSMLDGLFQAGDRVLLSSLKTKFHERLARIVDALYAELSGPGRHFVDSPRRVRGRWLALAGLVGVAAVLAGVSGRLSVPAAFALGLAAAVIGVFSRSMPRRTRQGRRVLEQILGFREFVARVDADRLEREGLRVPQHFERVLPYAIVLGVADHWAKLFADLYTRPPEWYAGAGRGPFRPNAFVGDLGRAIHTMGRTLASQPARSGSGSAFRGGGGSSGGGFGGGGGGSW